MLNWLLSWIKSKPIIHTYEDAIYYCRDNNYLTDLLIKQHLNLWDPYSLLVNDMKDRFGLGHADDLALVLLAGIEGHEPWPFVERCKLRWIALDIDPLTLVQNVNI